MSFRVKFFALILIVIGFFAFSHNSSAAPLSNTNADLDQYVWFDGTTYTASTTEANDTNANDFILASTTTTGSPAAYFGMNYKFNQIKLDIGTAGTDGAVIWEYWNGSAWAQATTTDNTSNLTTSGTIAIAPHLDWATSDPDGAGSVTDTLYWIRARTTTGYTTVPLGTQASAREFNLKVKVIRETNSTVVPNLIANNFTISGCADTTIYAFRPTGNGTYELGLAPNQTCNYTVIEPGMVVSSSASTGALTTTLTDRTASPDVVTYPADDQWIKITPGGGATTLGLKANGSVWAWGHDSFGQLGNGPANDGWTGYVTAPVQVFGLNGVGYLSDIVDVVSGGELSIALKSDGTLYGWGIGGVTGDGTNTDRNVPVRVVGPGGVGFLSDIVAISMGGGNEHVLALKSDGTLYSWGVNNLGQLGDNTIIAKNAPIQVHGPGDVGYLADVVAIAGGGEFSLAIKSDSTVWSWGWNNRGQLGDGTFVDKLTPVQIFGVAGVGNLMDIVGIIGGGQQSLALKSDGSLVAWGANEKGQLGNDTIIDSYTPVQVLGVGGIGFLSNIISIKTGNSFSTAIKSDGTVYNWGRNEQGTLGNGTNIESHIPVQVLGVGGVGYLSGIILIGGTNEAVLALKSDGTIYGWGGNNLGQLGDGTTSDRNTPVSTISYSDTLNASIDQYVWFDGTDYTDQTIEANNETTDDFTLGSDTTTNDPAAYFGMNYIFDRLNFNINPAGTDGIITWEYWNGATWTALTTGGSANNFFTSGAIIFTPPSDWATSDPDGAGSVTNTLYWIRARTSSGYSIVPLGTRLAVREFNLKVKVIREGDNQGITGLISSNFIISGCADTVKYDFREIGLGVYELGLKTGQTCNYTANVSGYVTSTSLTGTLTTSLLDKTSSPYTLLFGLKVITGDELNGMVLEEFSDIAPAVSSNNLALKSDGTVWAWGKGTSGELGNGTNDNSNVPVQVSNLTGITAVAGGGDHSLALKSDGTVWAWGKGTSGELGNGTNDSSNIPVQVSNLTDVTAITGGGGFSLALKSDDTVWAWGDNSYGELGNGTNDNSNVPVQVSGLTEVTAIIGGDYGSSYAVKSDGTAWAWGNGSNGLLGNHSANHSNIPVQVSESSGLSNVVMVASANTTSYALGSDGTVWAWGSGTSGQLGNGTNTSMIDFPVHVSNLTDVIKIAGGFNNGYALKSDGTVWAWGVNSYGELGNGTNIHSNIPVQVSGLTGVIKIGAGDSFAYTLKSDNTMWAWGYNYYSQLNDGTQASSNIPVRMEAYNITFRSNYATAKSESGNNAIYYFTDTAGSGALSIQKDGYVANETTNAGLSDITTSTSGQVVITLGNYDAVSSPITSSTNIKGLKYAVKVTATREGDNTALSGATVTAGSANTSCTEDGSTGIYYCPVLLADTGTTVSIIKNGYVTNTSGTYTDRTANTNPQRAVAVSVSLSPPNLRVKVICEGDSAVITGLTSDAFTTSDCADTTKYNFQEVGSGVYDLALLPDQTCNYTVSKNGYITTSAVSTGALTTSLTDRSGMPDTLQYAGKVTLNVSGATVTAGDSYGTTCSEDGTTKIYYCPIPLSDTSKLIKAVKSGYTDATGSFTADRTANTDAQQTATINLSVIQTSTDDDDDDDSDDHHDSSNDSQISTVISFPGSILDNSDVPGSIQDSLTDTLNNTNNTFNKFKDSISTTSSEDEQRNERVLAAIRSLSQPLTTNTGKAVTGAIALAGLITFLAVSPAAASAVSATSFGSLFRGSGLILEGLAGIKRKRKKWGVVYDSKTKAPLPLVRILIFSKDGRLLDGTTTDKNGRFGFLAKAGEYYLEAKKDKFVFPAKNSNSEDTYENVYTGGVFQIEKDQVIKLNLPMDGQGIDLRELSRQKIERMFSLKGKIGKYLVRALFYIGFTLTVITQFFAPTKFNTILLLAYASIVIYQLLFKKRDFGRVLDAKTEKPIPFAIINVFRKDNAQAKVKFIITDFMGRYYDLIENGEYLLKIKGESLDRRIINAQATVNINDGTLNDDIVC